MEYSDFTVTNALEFSALSDNLLPTEHRYREPTLWRAHLMAQNTATHSLVWSEQSGDKIVARSRSYARKGPEDIFWIMLPQQGEFVVEKDGERTQISVGRAVLLRPDETWRMYMPGSISYGLRIPRADIEQRLNSTGISRPVLNMQTGLGRIVQAMVDETHDQRSALTVSEFNAVFDRIGELLSMMSSGDMGPQRPHLTETAEAVRQFVRQNIGADLRLSAVARALSWSPRQLRLALHQAGTTYREVRQDESLRVARDMLEELGTHDTSIAEIAARCGFTTTWFSTAFKARYGETPREFRRRRLYEPSDQL
ncbi:AraC-like DNA-binding protein [Nocardia sp. GAS34]|uniref:helix-turn-helix domain-containing protein n=1 Tax=unclassified Nocardia TaxID=2637762 RepID=UPI003D215860